MTLRLPDGTAPPLGAEVRLAGATTPLVMGRHGEVYLPDLRAQTEGTVIYPAGSCHFSVTPPAEASKDTIPKIGPIVCAAGGGT